MFRFYGLATPFNVTPDPNHPHQQEHPSALLAFAPGAFAELITEQRGSLQIEYRNTLRVACQQEGTLELWEEPHGLMFSARVRVTPLTLLLALGVWSGAVRHCCSVGEYSSRSVDKNGAVTRAYTLEINLLCHWLRSRPSFSGTWVSGLWHIAFGARRD